MGTAASYQIENGHVLIMMIKEEMGYWNITLLATPPHTQAPKRS